MSAKRKHLDSIEGVFRRYLYQGNKGWSVGILELTDHTETVVTGGLTVKAGDFLRAFGSWQNHPKFGRQFKVEDIEFGEVSGRAGIVGYLERLPNVGPVRANTIFKTFKDDTFRVIEAEPHRLTEAPGITPRMVQAIHEAFMADKKDRDLVVFLKQFGLTDLKIAKIMSTYGSDLERVLKETPYRMVEEIDGFGFKTVDDIALAAGLDRNSPLRIQAGVLHVLQEAAGEGSTCLPVGDVWMSACKLLTVPADMVHLAVVELKASKRIIQHYDRLALTEYLSAEMEIAACVAFMSAPGESQEVAA